MQVPRFWFELPAPVRHFGLCVYALRQARARFGGAFSDWYQYLSRTQWSTTRELKAMQLENLMHVVESAYQHVPYYRTAFLDHGVKPSDISSLADLRKLPTLTRQQILHHLPDLRVRRNAGMRAVRVSTSGSTGQKVSFYLPHELKWAINTAVIWRFYRWADVELRDRRATLGARIFTLKPPYWAWNRWENQLLLSAHHLNPENVTQYVELLKRFKITFIQGHPSAVAAVAKHVLASGTQLRMKAVFTTGETVYGEDRAAVQEAFRCSLFDVYGMGESAAAAAECGLHTGFHEASEYCILELEPAGGGLYELVATSLLNHAMPFIRYRTGDLVYWRQGQEACRCGRGLPLKFGRVLGRVDDVLVFERDMLLPVTVRMLMKPLLAHGECYQVIQESAKDLRVILTGEVTSERRDRIRSRLSDRLPEGLRISVEHAEDIRGENNKIRNVINNFTRVRQ